MLHPRRAAPQQTDSLEEGLTLGRGRIAPQFQNTLRMVLGQHSRLGGLARHRKEHALGDVLLGHVGLSMLRFLCNDTT